MIDKKHFGLVMGISIMMVLGLTMSVTVQLLTSGKATFMPTLIMTLEAFAVNFAASLIIPANKLGDQFARKMGCEERTFGFLAASNLIVCGIYVTVVSFVMTLINVGLVPILFAAWLSVYPIVFVLGYLVSLAVTPLVFKLTTAIVTGR